MQDRRDSVEEERPSGLPPVINNQHSERSLHHVSSHPCTRPPWQPGRENRLYPDRIHTPAAPPCPSGRSGEKEEPGITLWAGPKVLFINAVFPGIDLEDLQISITGKRLVFSGPLRSDTAIKKAGRRRPQSTPMNFTHSVELPYPVDADRTEVRKENGLISIILKKDESRLHDGNARLESSIMNSMKRYFGNNGRSVR